MTTQPHLTAPARRHSVGSCCPSVHPLACAILHADPLVRQQLEGYVERVTPSLRLVGSYSHAEQAIRGVGLGHPCVDVWFVGLTATGEGEAEVMAFARRVAGSARLVFLSDTGRLAASCFRLDALDYLLHRELTLPVFIQTVGRALRWFARERRRVNQGQLQEVFVRSSGSFIRLSLTDIRYIESLGEAIRIHCNGRPQPVVIRSSLSRIERNLPSGDFLRVHRSLIVRADAISTISPDAVHLPEGITLPIGHSFRQRVEKDMAHMAVP